MKAIIFLITALCSWAVVPAQQTRTLENKNIRAVFDLSSGALIALQNKTTGWNILPQNKNGKSFEMLVNLPGKGNIMFTGENQAAPKITNTKNSIVFLWQSLQTNKWDKQIDITFKGIVTLTGKGIEYSGEVVNNSGNTIELLTWPIIEEVAMPEKSQRLLFQYLTYTKMNTVQLYPEVNSYTGWSNLPEHSFVLLNNEKQGLYISSKDYQLKELVRCMYEILPNSDYAAFCGDALSKKDNGERNYMRLQIKNCRELHRTGKEKITLVPIVLQPYTGSWHNGVDIYKEWRKTWYIAPPRPQWVKDVNTWQQLQINSSEDYLGFNYKDIVNYAKECKQYGVNAIQLTGWNKGGQDRGVPFLDTDPRLGTFEDLKTAIAESQKLGVHILLFTKFTWIDLTSDKFEAYKDYIAKDAGGNPELHPGYNYNTYTQLMGINTRRFGVLCMVDADCRKALCEEFKKCLDLGAAGMVYDENQHHAGHMLCFDRTHAHAIPGFLYKGADLLGHDFLQMTKKYDPDFLMNGEGPYDLQSKYYSTYTRADVYHIPVLRYIDPDIPIACAVLGHDDHNTINMCLRDRYAISYEPRYFKGHLSEFPRLMAYGNKVDALRKKYKDFLWNAEFKDVLGATVTGRDIDYSIFENKTNGKKTIVVLNRSEHEASTATIKSDNSKASWVIVSPENPDPAAFTGTVTLQPQSVVVVMEQ